MSSTGTLLTTTTGETLILTGPFAPGTPATMHSPTTGTAAGELTATTSTGAFTFELFGTRETFTLTAAR